MVGGQRALFTAQCLSAMPDEPNAMMNWGYAFMKLAEMEHRPDVYVCAAALSPLHIPTFQHSNMADVACA